MAGRKMQCFVISPIGDRGSRKRKHADLVLEKIIVAALERVKGLVNFDSPVRSDRLGDPGRISDQIFDRITRADLCIAVLTDQNANVCYELGIAHSLRIPVVNLLDCKQKPL